MLKVTITYNHPVGDFKAKELRETFYALRRWKTNGTLVYFQIDRFNYKTVAESEIVSVVSMKY